MEKKRVAYLDFIKVFAMFIVTIGHCAQSLSTQLFPDRLIHNDFFVTIHMPLFMIASGFVLNFDKIRETPIKEYIYSKFSRLIIPLLSWLILYCIFTIKVPNIDSVFYTYWYLAALFFSLLVVRILSSFIKNNIILIIVSLLFVMFIPISKVSHTNFMFPFLIYGYFLREYINKINYLYFIPLAIIFIILYLCYWGIEHTVYLAPFDILNIDCSMLYSFVLRFIIGIVGSTFIFLLIKKFDHTPFVKKISEYGKYTLVFYTMTTVINGFTMRFFNYIDFCIVNPLLLDTLSIIFTLV